MKMNKEVVMVRISDIIPNRFQPRLTFDEEALNELANSIKEHGIIQPLILRDLGSKYEIIAGERRYKASQLAGLMEVPAIVGTMDDQTSAELALIENIQRKDLSAIEEAKSYKIILDMGNFTQEELAKRMGKSQSTIANKMRLLTLTNEVQMALMNSLISERHARCLLQIKDGEMQKEVLNRIITERMNVRDTDEYIKNTLGISRIEPSHLEKEQQMADESQPQIYNNNNNKIEEQLISANDVKFEFPEMKENGNKETKDNAKSKEDNPNVYTQSANKDFVNISNLNEDEQPQSPIKSALSSLNVVSVDSDVFGGNDVSVEEKEENSVENIEIPSSKNELTKIKMATAIRLAKDSVDEIRKSGYNVTLEEIEGQNDYQIVIKIEK